MNARCNAAVACLTAVSLLANTGRAETPAPSAKAETPAPSAKAETPPAAISAGAVGSAERARALFRDGRALAAAGHYVEACPKFEESLKIDPGIGTKFNLADCFDHVGRPATARVLFLEVADRAHEAGQREREEAARARAGALESSAPQLIIDVKTAAPKLEIRRDGAAIEPSAWGAPRPVDPGKHRVLASAPGRKPWSKEIDVALSASPVTVEVPDLEEDAPAAAAPAVVAVKDPKPEAPERKPVTHRDAPPPPPPRTEDNTVPILLYTGVGAGVLLTAASLVFYKLSNDKAETICTSGVGCTADDIQRHDGLVSDARTSRGLAYLGLGITGASLAAGGIVSLTHPRRKEAPPSGCVTAGPLVGRDGLGAAVRGSF